jgi:hypothetical protein
MLSRLDDFFEEWDLLIRRRQDWRRRNLPLPDEKGNEMEAKARARVMDFARELDEGRDATFRYLNKQGKIPRIS